MVLLGMRGPYFQTGSHAFGPGLKILLQFGGAEMFSSFSFFNGCFLYLVKFVDKSQKK